MEFQLGALGFNIPRQTLEAGTSVPLTISGITTWRAELPLADMGASAKQVFGVLSEINQVKLKALDRFEMMELFRPPLQYIYQGLRKHYLNQTQPLSDRKMKIAQLLQLLMGQMITGYKLVIEHLVAEQNKSGIKTVLPQAIYQALNYANQLMLHHTQLYQFPEENAWKEIHLLYQLSEKYKCSEAPLTKDTKRLSVATIKDAYVRLILMAASNPFQWRQSDQSALNNALVEWLSLVNLKAFDARNQNSASIAIIDLALDEPGRIAHENLNPKSELKSLLLMSLVEHLKVLSQELAENEMEARLAHHEAEYAVSTYIIDHLIKQWSVAGKTPKTQFLKSNPVELAIGLGAAHFFLNDSREFAPPGSETPKAVEKTPTGLSLATDEAQVIAETIDFSNLSTTNSVAAKQPGGYTIQMGSLSEDDERFAYLHWPLSQRLAIQPGELIVVRPASHEKPWHLASLREVKNTPQEQQIRIEWLTDKAIAASIQLIKENQPAGYHLRCLFIANPTSHDPEQTKVFPHIITPTLPFKTHHEASLLFKLDGPVKHIRLNQQKENTACYKEFLVTEVQGEGGAPPPSEPLVKKAAPAPKKPKNEEGEFDSIWSSL